VSPAAATISPDALEALLRGTTPHALLDLRERATYERGHIYRATSLPRRLLESRLPQLVTGRGTTVVLCDEDGSLADLARPTLAAMGYTDVRALDGGLADWRKAARRLVQGYNVPSKVFGERVLHEMKTPEIDCPGLQAWIDAGKDMVIVDSRTPQEYHRGCIPGSISMPGGELLLRIGELVQRPDTTIVVHCGGRTRSYLGAESVRRLGLPNPVVAVKNGTMGWQLAGLELERGATRWHPSDSPAGRAAAAQAAKRLADQHRIAMVTPEELQALWAARERDGLAVLDVRTHEEYAAGHVAGSVWAPGGQAVQATDEYVAVRAATIVLVCDDTSRSVSTAAWLTIMGLPRVRVLAGGLPAWERGGGAVERGHPAPEPFGLSAARSRVASVDPGSLPAGAEIIDVDQSDVYKTGHLPGAGWLCRSRLEQTIGRAVPDRARTVVLTCETGVQSTLAAATLAALGYRDARVLAGGTKAWAAAGRPLETGATRLLDEADDVLLKPYERGREGMVRYLEWEEELDEHGWSPKALLPGAGS
jgi:rhodanese-related sulfurtransferase